MSYTEEEAKTKWCPFYSIAVTGDGQHFSTSDNRPVKWKKDDKGISRPISGGLDRSACCMASACMAWQWITPEYQCLDRAPDEPETWYLASNGWNKVEEGDNCPNCQKKPIMRILHYWRKNAPRSGNCGLAT